MATENIEYGLIFERELTLCCQQHTVKFFRLAPVDLDDPFKFHLYVRLKKDVKGHFDFVLCAENTKAPREWANLDRAYRHFRDKYQYAGLIYISNQVNP